MAFNRYKYQNDYNKETYDRLNIQVPKGKKAIIEEHWRAKGYKSLNSYVNALIAEDMAKDDIRSRLKVREIGDRGGMHHI